MRFRNVSLAALAHDLPAERVNSEALEQRLEPLYARFSLRVGRLELMTGIRERRFATRGAKPSGLAAAAGERALATCGVHRSRIGMLVHAAVCRDFLEPATASVVHETLGLPADCTVFDLSNACLGFANAMLLIGQAIELGALEAGLVVSGEDGRALVETTIADLLERAETVTRAELKRALASLTIGSGAAAAVLCRTDLAPNAPRLVGGTVRADTSHVELCRGDVQPGQTGPLMDTDSEALLEAGCALAARTFPSFLEELGWERARLDRYVTHQVGSAHRRTLQNALELSPERDHPTVEFLGNVGTVSLPASLSLAREAGHVIPEQRVAMLGIGSGLHCAMLGLET